MNFLDVMPDLVALSSATEGALSVEQIATAGGMSAAMLGVLPMGLDPDSVAFSAALIATGTAYLAGAAEHSAQRGLHAVGQGLASGVYVTNEGYNQAAAAFRTATTAI